LGKCGWNVRLYKADDYWDDLDVVGNFGAYKNRQKDDVVVFSGMYGIDDYFIWYMHKDIGAYDFSTINIDLSLYADGNLSKTFWRRQYKILDVKYDANKSKYVLFGTSLDSVKLQSKLVDYEVKSLSYKENRSPKDILIDVLETNEIFKVEYMESQYEESLRNFEYRMFTFDENWKVIDFINYIADQNHFEWYVRNSVLYIGNECKAIRGMNTTRKFDLETDNVSESAWFKKYSGETRSMDVLAHISEVWRCIWVKHMAGSKGGISKGCFTKIGIGTLDKENYIKTLEGQPEKTLASKLFINKPYSHYISLGNIIEDDGDPIWVEKISVQKNKELYKINEPSDVMIDRGDIATSPLKQVKERVVRSTPYLDAGGGMLFPSPLLEEKDEDENETPIKGIPPNVLLFKIKGKEEATVIGPYVMGNSEDDFKEYKIPFKGRKDFRFSLPNGWTMYVDGDYGKLLFQCDGVPSYSEIGPGFPYPGNEDFNPNGQEKTYIYMRPLETEASVKRNEISLNAGLGNKDEEVGSKLKVMSDDGFYFITKDVNNNKEVKVEFTKDKIILTAEEGGVQNKITIDSINYTIDIEADSDITINSKADINVNASGLVNLQGGSFFLPKDIHTHQVTPGPAIPGPPATATPTSDLTTKTKAT